MPIPIDDPAELAIYLMETEFDTLAVEMTELSSDQQERIYELFDEARAAELRAAVLDAYGATAWDDHAAQQQQYDSEAQAAAAASAAAVAEFDAVVDDTLTKEPDIRPRLRRADNAVLDGDFQFRWADERYAAIYENGTIVAYMHLPVGVGVGQSGTITISDGIAGDYTVNDEPQLANAGRLRRANLDALSSIFASGASRRQRTISVSAGRSFILFGDAHDDAVAQAVLDDPARDTGSVTFTRYRTSPNLITVAGLQDPQRIVDELQRLLPGTDYPYRDLDRIRIEVGEPPADEIVPVRPADALARNRANLERIFVNGASEQQRQVEVRVGGGLVLIGAGHSGAATSHAMADEDGEVGELEFVRNRTSANVILVRHLSDENFSAVSQTIGGLLSGGLIEYPYRDRARVKIVPA